MGRPDRPTRRRALGGKFELSPSLAAIWDPDSETPFDLPGDAWASVRAPLRARVRGDVGDAA